MRQRIPACTLGAAVRGALATLACGLASQAWSCDLCTISGSSDVKRAADAEEQLRASSDARTQAIASGRGLSVGVIVRYQDDDIARDGGERVDGEQQQGRYHQYLASEDTELMLGYRLSPRLGLRAYLPYEVRRFQTLDSQTTAGLSENGLVSGSERGLGDATVEATAVAYRHIVAESMQLTTVLAGCTLPSGESAPLQQEALIAAGGSPSGHLQGGTGPVTLVHPHDLALGTGAVGLVAGISEYAAWRHVFLTARALDTDHFRGRADYRFGNSLAVAGGPGFYLRHRPDQTLGLQAYLSAEDAAHDQVGHAVVGASGGRDLALGPELSGSWHGRASAELGIDWVLLDHVHGQQLSPRSRWHAGLNWSF